MNTKETFRNAETKPDGYTLCAPSMGVVSKIQRDTKGCKSLAGKLVLVC